MSKTPGADVDDTLLAVSTPSFDMSLSELSLRAPYPMVQPDIASSQEVKDILALINLIEEHNVTILLATPSLWSMLLTTGWEGKRNFKGISGGEALTSNLISQIIPKVNEFWNCYGPTKTTMCSTGIRILDPNARILIGKPMDNTKIYVLDKHNQMLPIGVIGEVAIGGLGVSKGYINRPELTIAKFITFDNNQVVYKTGDQGRILADGNIELFGRNDNQIKLRGYRIELGEIENMISSLPGVKDTVVKVNRFNDSDERLVAFISVDKEFKMIDREIKVSLARNLPPYMIPSFFQISESLPLLSNGKINRRALLYETKELEKNLEQDFDSLTETQKKIIAMWEDILKVKNISPSDNFFEIGGNSLLAITIFAKIESTFDVKIRA